MLHQNKDIIKKKLLANISGLMLLGMFLCAQPLLAVTLDLQIGNGNDDAFEYGDNGNVIEGDEQLKIYSDTSATSHDYRYGGMRWANVTIPAGANISNAWISIYPNETGDDDINVDIHFEVADAPADFTGGAYSISNRSRTTAFTRWILTRSAVNSTSMSASGCASTMWITL